MASDFAGLRQYYQGLCGTEQAKNQLIEDLLERLDRLNRDHQQEKLDHARESDYNRAVQLRELDLKEKLRTQAAQIERDAFILVLIDGDGMIFEDRLLQAGEAGGKEAANILWISVRDYVHQNIPKLSSDYKIVTRIYANLKGLGDACKRAGILDSHLLIEDFARGFTGSKQLFDFVDVGSGKDRADDKICELFKLHLYNCHCRHIIFGCSHDNGYARLLEDVADEPMHNHISLLEGVPYEREIAAIKSKYGNAKFEGLFRTAKIVTYQQFQSQPQGRLPLLNPSPMMPNQVSLPHFSNGAQSTQKSSKSPQMFSNDVQSPQHLSNGTEPTQFTNGRHSTPSPNMTYQSPYQPLIAHTPSTSTSSSVVNPVVASWAAKAVSVPPAQIVSPPLTPKPAGASSANIPRNKFGQRVDPVMKYDMNEVKRVQKIHMCNVHFLRRDCPYGDDCTHDHYYKPNKNELDTLKFVARQTACKFGSACDDIKCIYGHRCPAAMEGCKICRFGENCRFAAELHGIDMKIVRTTKVS